MSYENNPARLDRQVYFGESDALNFAFTNRDGSSSKSMAGYKLIITIKNNNFDKNILLRKEYDLTDYLIIASITPSEIRDLGCGCFWYDCWIENPSNVDYEEPLVFGRYSVNYLSKREMA